jgi:hypothetical protein
MTAVESRRIRLRFGWTLPPQRLGRWTHRRGSGRGLEGLGLPWEDRGGGASEMAAGAAMGSASSPPLSPGTPRPPRHQRSDGGVVDRNGRRTHGHLLAALELPAMWV